MELKTKTEIQRQKKNKEPRSDFFFHQVRVFSDVLGLYFETTYFGLRENHRLYFLFKNPWYFVSLVETESFL